MSLLKQQEVGLNKNPNRLLIYAHPGQGKTAIMSGLPNSILFDFEDRSHHLKGNIYNIKEIALNEEVNEVSAFGLAINDLKARIKEDEKNKPDFLIVDTFSSLEKDVIMPHATTLFGKTLIGKGMARKGEIVTDVVSQLPNGGGYIHFFKAYESIINSFAGLYNKCIIYNCHTKQSVKIRGIEELGADDIYATGKVGKDLVQNCQAVAQLYQIDRKVYLSFEMNERRLVTKASSKHLFDKKILISEIDEKDNFIYYWDKIFPGWV